MNLFAAYEFELQSLQNQLQMGEVLSKIYKWKPVNTKQKNRQFFECPRQLEAVSISRTADGTELFFHHHTHKGGTVFALARFLSGKDFGKGVRFDQDDVQKCKDWVEELKASC
jgi:hypothetical protein